MHCKDSVWSFPPMQMWPREDNSAQVRRKHEKHQLFAASVYLLRRHYATLANCICCCTQFSPFVLFRSNIGGYNLKVGWRGKFFWADQNQHVSKPTQVKLQWNGHSRRALKSVHNFSSFPKPSVKRAMFGQCCPGIYQEGMWPAITIVLNGKSNDMASTGRKPYRQPHGIRLGCKHTAGLPTQ